MKKILLIIFSISLFFIPAVVNASTLDDLYQQKQDLQNSISANQQQIDSLEDMIGSLDAQNAATQKQISLTAEIINVTNQEIADTQQQIEQKQAELEKKKADLHEAIVTFYETGTPSSLEILASANSLSDVIDKSQYMQSISDQMDRQADEIAKAKADLESKRNELEKKEADLQSQKDSLVNEQRNLQIQADAKNNLLSQVSSKQSSLEADLDHVSAAIYAERERQGGYITGGSGGYPWAGASTDGVDPWGFYYRQCTSYAAWYFNAVEGKNWYSFRRLGVDRSSNGGDWAALGSYQGYSVTSTPRPGAIVSWPAGGIFGGYGHVAIVQSVNGDGTFNLSEYNWVPYGYSERNNVSPSGASFIY